MALVNFMTGACHVVGQWLLLFLNTIDLVDYSSSSTTRKGRKSTQTYRHCNKTTQRRQIHRFVGQQPASPSFCMTSRSCWYDIQHLHPLLWTIQIYGNNADNENNDKCIRHCWRMRWWMATCKSLVNVDAAMQKCGLCGWHDVKVGSEWGAASFVGWAPWRWRKNWREGGNILYTTVNRVH